MSHQVQCLRTNQTNKTIPGPRTWSGPQRSTRCSRLDAYLATRETAAMVQQPSPLPPHCLARRYRAIGGQQQV